MKSQPMLQHWISCSCAALQGFLRRHNVTLRDLALRGCHGSWEVKWQVRSYVFRIFASQNILCIMVTKGKIVFSVERESYAYKYLVGRLQGRTVGKPGRRWWDNIKTNIKNGAVWLWNEFMRSRIETSGVLMWIRWWTFELHDFWATVIF